MSKQTTTITENGDYLILKSTKPRNADCYKATVVVSGTFGSGTIAWQLSADKGVTKVAAKDTSGSAFSTTAADNFNIELGGSAIQGGLELYAALTGATNPSLTISVFDQD